MEFRTDAFLLPNYFAISTAISRSIWISIHISIIGKFLSFYLRVFNFSVCCFIFYVPRVILIVVLFSFCRSPWLFPIAASVISELILQRTLFGTRGEAEKKMERCVCLKFVEQTSTIIDSQGPCSVRGEK